MFFCCLLFSGAVLAQQQSPEPPSRQAPEPALAPQPVVLRTDTIAVAGRCKHCKKRIEQTLRELEGVSQAEWDVASKRLVVTYDPERLNRRTIQERLAAVGHDTEEIPAPDDAYAKLPKCCRYRPQ